MQRELAEVTFIDGEYAFLKTSNKSGCGECSSKSSCGSVKLFQPVVENDVIKIKNTLAAKTGDSVVLTLPPSTLLKGTFLVYLLPLFSLIIFAVLGKVIIGEGASILAGLSGFVISLVFVSKFLAKKEVSQQFIPKMLEKV